MGINSKLRWGMLGVFLLAEVAVFIPAENRRFNAKQDEQAISTASQPQHLLPAIINAQSRTDEVIIKISALSEGEEAPFWKSSLILNYVRNREELKRYIEAQDAYLATQSEAPSQPERPFTSETELGSPEQAPSQIEGEETAIGDAETLSDIVNRVMASRERAAALRSELNEIAQLQIDQADIIQSITFGAGDDFSLDAVSDEWFALLESREVISKRVSNVYDDFPELTLTNPQANPLANPAETADAEPFRTPPPGLYDE